MYENKSLQLAFLISVILHFALFLSSPYRWVLPEKQPIRPIKVAYIKEKEIPKKLIGQRPGKSGGSRALPPMSPEALPEVRKEDIVSSPLQPVQPPVKPGQVKKEEPTVETIGARGGVVIGGKGKKFEAVINEEGNSARKATYIGYYRSVREKIRYYADGNYVKEGSTAQGEVFISFTVASSGELLHIMVIDKRSTQDTLLRSIAIDSIRDASPFLAFPQGMNQYQITFNVIISFELNK
jgi:hypothetical protein